MPSVLATAGITNCDVPISNSNGTGAKTQPWPKLFLVLPAILESFQHHQTDGYDNCCEGKNYQDLDGKGNETDKGDQLLKQHNYQGDNNEKTTTPSCGS